MLVARIRSEYPGKEILTTWEPWEMTESGRRIRRILAHKESTPEPAVLQRIYVDNRHEHWGLEVAPAIAEGKVVICDRERFSTYAYGRAFGVPQDVITDWHRNLTMPDLFLYFQVAAATAMNRMSGRGEAQQYFEQEQKVAKVIDAYNKEVELGTLPNVIVIDGEKGPDQVHEQVWEHVQRLM